MNVPRAQSLIYQIPADDFRKLIGISKYLQKAGYECYLIGGSVRDLILGKIPHEYDLTTNATPAQVKQVFNRVIDTGIEHGTVTVLLGGMPFEITTYREDVGYSDGRRPDQIRYSQSLSEDLKRRDFTMNAIALNLIEEQLIDEHHGIADIEKGCIRTIGDPVDRFSEDGLRPIRAIRFMATLGFQIDEQTYQAIQKTRDITQKISIERFHDELNKILKAERPYPALLELHKQKIFELFVDLNQQRTPEKLAEVEQLAIQPSGLRLSYLLHYLLGENPDHSLATSILKSLKYSNKNTQEAMFFIKLLAYKNGSFSAFEVRKLLSQICQFAGYQELERFLLAYESHLQIRQPESWQQFRQQANQVLKKRDPLILKDLATNGTQIKKEFPHIKGVQIGKILQSCLEYIWQEPQKNNETELIQYIKEKLVELS